MIATLPFAPSKCRGCVGGLIFLIDAGFEERAPPTSKWNGRQLGVVVAMGAVPAEVRVAGAIDHQRDKRRNVQPGRSRVRATHGLWGV